MFFWFLFVLSALVCIGLHALGRSKRSTTESRPVEEVSDAKSDEEDPRDSVEGDVNQTEKLVGDETMGEFRKFQRLYLVVFFVMFFADWLQGPYVYKLYEDYGFSKGEIGGLFVAGYGSSMVFGTFVGGIADKFGRKKLAIVFGVCYGSACLLYAFSYVPILLLGRVLAGIATSLLWSVFEAWMVHEHTARGFPAYLLSSTFAIATTGNGLLAIAAGLVANPLAETWSSFAPFAASFVVFLIGTVVVVFTWNENYGNESTSVLQTFATALDVLRRDRRVLLLGISQSLFEASMFCFVFLWTPSLNDPLGDATLPLGLLFSIYMICTMIGSSLFSLAMKNGLPVVSLSRHVLVLAFCALTFVPLIFPFKKVVFICFMLFEVSCGLFWPTWGVMRSKLIPEESRAAIINFFRVPLNFLVIIVLFSVERFSDSGIFFLFSTWLVAAYVSQWILQKTTV